METTTIEKMKKLYLRGMATTYDEDLKINSMNQYTIREYLSKLVDAEWENRQNRKIKNLKRAAKFRSSDARPSDIDYTTPRGLDKEVIQRIMNLDFIKSKENIILTGSTGTGKSYLAQAIGVRACEMLYKVGYFTMSQFTEEIQAMKIQGNLYRCVDLLKNSTNLKLTKFELL
jgi:DNA replication protein DnaC